MPRYNLPRRPISSCALAHAAEALRRKSSSDTADASAVNTIEGTALDRLWQSYSEQGRTAGLWAEYEGGTRFASEMVLGILLRKALRAPSGRGDQRAIASRHRTRCPCLRWRIGEREGDHEAGGEAAGPGRLKVLSKDDLRQETAAMDIGDDGWP